MIYYYRTFPHPDAIAEIHALEKRYPGSRLGMGTGWSSPKMLATEITPGILAAVETSGTLFSKFYRESVRLTAWANIMRPGDSIGPHDHVTGEHNDWSGAYYLTPGADIVFENGERHTPEPGLLLIWPASLKHWVEVQGEGERISIAWNAKKNSI